MSECVKEEEDRSESPGSSCPSSESDRSELESPKFSTEPGPSDTKVQSNRQRSEPPGSSCVSLKSDWSKDRLPPVFSTETGPSDTKKRRLDSEKKQSSCCVWCQDVLKDPVSTSCGHWFCRRCITSDWDQSASPGDSCCPQCGVNVGLLEVLDEHKISLRKRCECVTEGSEEKSSDETGSGTLLNRIYTELYITEGQSEEVNTQHEVWQLETASKKKTFSETPIRCCDIFKASSDQQRRIRVVLTNGVPGVGKTFSVQKFTLDWAEGSENQDVSLLVLLSFRELNLIRNEQYSLLRLLHVFHPTLQKVTAEKLPSDRAGPEPQQPAGFRSEAAVSWTAESKLSTGDSEIERLHIVREQLYFTGLSSEVQPFLSQRAGPELQQAAGFRSEAAV